ncbi:MAG: hypothetical protein AAF197_00330 [Pseudomonadota bacterium]
MRTMNKFGWRKARTQQGFSALELVLVLSVLTLLTLQFVPLQEQFSEAVAENYTVTGLTELAKASKSFYGENGAWPGDLNTLIGAGFLPGYSTETGPRFNNGFGASFNLTQNGNILELSTTVDTFQNARAIASTWGPLSKVSGTLVTVSVLRPGTEVAHDRLLNRFGEDDGMQAGLEMNDNNIVDAGAVNSDTVSTNIIVGRERIESEDLITSVDIEADNYIYK